MTIAAKFGAKSGIGSFGVILACLWLLAVLAAPFASAQLAINNFSIHATMPDATGLQQVTTSFQLVNNGATKIPATTTTVQTAGVVTILATPRLVPGATAFFGTTTATTLNNFNVVINAPNNTTSTYSFSVGQTARWQPIGPSVIMHNGFPVGVGRVTAIAIDGSQTGTVYVGARNSGLWKTTDAGGHWEPLTDALPSLNIYAVAVDSASTQHVVIATPAGVFSSANGGHVWTLINGNDLQAHGNDGGAFILQGFRPVICCATPAAAATTTSGPASALASPDLSIFPFNRIFAYITTANGLEVSSNGGANWSFVLGGGNASSLDQDRSNPAHMLAAISGPPGSGNSAVFETYLGGLLPAFWHKLQGCPSAQVPALPDQAGIWVTQSGGTQWISVKKGTQHDIWSTTGQTCFINGNLEHGWQHIFSGNPCGADSTWSFLHADPANPQVVYKAGVDLCRSTDGGASFQIVNGVHSDHHALAFHPLFPNLLFEGNDGGFYESLNGGQTFSFDAVGLSVTEFLDTDVGGASPRVVLGASQDNSVSATDLTSPVWQLADADGDGVGVVVDPQNSNIQYAVGQAADHVDIVNNGVPSVLDTTGLITGCLSYSESPFLFSQFLATASTNWHLVIASGDQGAGCGGLWTGPPWVQLFTATNNEPFVRITYDASIGLFLAGGDAGSVYIGFSPDVLAQVWRAPCDPNDQANPSGLGGFLTAIVPDPYAVGNYFVACRSTANGSFAGRIFEIHSVSPLQFGASEITANLPLAQVMTLAANPNEAGVLYAGTRGQGVFKGVRDATGQWSWQLLSNGMPLAAVVTKLRYDTNSGNVYASTYGRGEFVFITGDVTIF